VNRAILADARDKDQNVLIHKVTSVSY